MAEYSIHYGREGRYIGTSLVQARKMAVGYLQEHKNRVYVGVFDQTNKKYIGRVGRTNSFPFTWEVPTSSSRTTYKLVNLLKEDGTVAKDLMYSKVFNDGFYW